MYENLNNNPTLVSVSGVRKGSWSVEEDDLLRKCIHIYGEGNWKRIPKRAGLNRCRKSCRWRWLNYLKPSIKRGDFSDDEISIIVKQHKLLGNRWSLIAGSLPGRTINDVKNYCNTHIYKKFSSEAISTDEECNIQRTKIKPPPTSTPINTTHQNYTFSRVRMLEPAITKESMGPMPIDLGPIKNPLVIDTLDEVEEHDNSAKWWEDILVELQRGESDGLSHYTSGPTTACGSSFGEEVSNVNDGIDATNTSLNETPSFPFQWDEDPLEFDVRLWE